MRIGLAGLGVCLLLAAGPLRAEEPATATGPSQPLTPAPIEPQGCRRTLHPGLIDGPVTIGFGDADFGAGHRACPRTEVAIYGRGAAVLDTPNFYGSLEANGVLSASFALNRKVEIFGTLEFLRFLYVQEASLKGSATSFGQLTLGGALVVLETRTAVITPYARLMLPTSSATPDVRTLGGEVGVAWTWRPLIKLGLHGSVGGDVAGGISAAPGDVRGGAMVIAGLQYTPWTWLALALDLDLQLGHRAPLDLLAPALGLRFRLYRTLGLELDAAAPVVGADRRLFLAALRLTYRF